MTLLVIPASLPLPASRVHSRESAFVATVADATTNQPVTDAEVFVTDLARSARTNWIGEAIMAHIPAGTHHVRVRRLGYAEAELDIAFDRDTVGVFFSLSPRPQSMDTVRTSAEASLNLHMGEFEMRRRLGIGRFLTDSILRADSTLPLADILERRIPGLVAVDEGRKVERRNIDPVIRRDCNKRIDTYIDGVRVSTPAYTLHEQPDETDLRFLSGRDIAGVEYYTDVSAPVQYRHQTMACGVLLIWLRY